MLNIVAIITTKPGKRAEVLDIFNANVPNVHAEDGCIEYGATVDYENAGDFQTEFGDDTFVVVEKWESLDALKAHIKAPHMVEYGQKVKDLQADRRIYIMSDA